MSCPHLSLADLLDDPMEALRRARSAGDVAEFESAGVAVLRYEAGRALLNDPRARASFTDFLRTCGVESGPFFEWMATSPLDRDGAEHKRWRGLMSRTFTPRRVEALRPFLRSAAHELIDGFAARGSCELMADFADPYPSLGLCELIGVPAEDRDRFRGWANTVGLGFSPFVAQHIAAVDAALSELLDYTGDLAARRRAEPRDDLVSRIAQAADEEGGWSDFEVRGAIAGLVFAGHETTKTQLGWNVASLSERPDLWDALGDGRIGAAVLVEELMRYRSAAAIVSRTVGDPLRVGGEDLSAGVRVTVSLWSANHDESVYPHPERLDPEQSARAPHMSFGHGPHHCLGAALARAELQEALAALTARLTCPVIGAGAAWKPPVGINGPERLPVSFTAR